MKQQELSFIAVGMQNDTATLEDSLSLSYKTNILLPQDPVITLLGIYPNNISWKFTSIYVHKRTDVYSSFIHNCQNLEATKMSFNRWMDKQTVVHPGNGMLFSARKEISYKARRRRGGPSNVYFLVKEASVKGLHTVWFQLYEILENQNYSKKISDCQKLITSFVIQGFAS